MRLTDLTRSLVLASLVAAFAVSPAAAVGPAPTAGTRPAVSFALWEVPTLGPALDASAGFGHGVLVKSFTPDMNVVKYLDRAQANGLKVILHFNDVIKYGSGYSNGYVYPARIKAWTDKVKNHPALHGYLTVKEPAWQGISLREMQSLYREFKRQDPKHTVVALLGDTPNFGTSRNPWAKGVADMLWVDWYPVSCSKGYWTGATRNFPKVRSYVDRVTPGTPIWVITQGHAYKKGDKCRPTPAQLRRQVREALTYMRADGIVFYTWNNGWYESDLGRDPALQTELKRIIRDVKNGTF